MNQGSILQTGAPRSPKRTWDENDGAKPLRTPFAKRARYCPERAIRTKVKTFEDIVFGPCTLGRTRISCYAAPGHNRVCGFLRGKPHAARQRHQPRQEIRGTWGTRPEP